MPSKSSLSEVVELITFTVAEVHRLNHLSENGLGEQVAKESGIHDFLPGARGDFPPTHYTCSRAVTQRLADLTSSRIEHDPDLRGRIKFGTYFRALRAEIGVRAIRGNEKVTEQLAKEILQAAKAFAVSKLVSARYYFPAHGVETQSNLKEYTLGGVLFEDAELFFRKRRSEWDASIELSLKKWEAEYASDGEEFDASFYRKNFAQIEEHFKEYRWMASVEIVGMEDDAGYDKAEEIIDKTSSILRLCVPSHQDSFIGVASHKKNDRERARFMSPGQGSYETTIFFRPPSGALVADSFFTEMRKFVGMREVEVALQNLARLIPLTPAEQRLMSALTWYGEAWKDAHAEAKLVKYAICLESLFMSGGKEGLTEILAERLALLAELSYEDVHKRYLQVREVYDARSKAVHGDISKHKIDFVRLSRNAEELARLGVLAYAQLIPLLGETPDLNAKLSAFFTALKLGGSARALDTLRG